MKLTEVYNSKIANLLGYSITVYPFILYVGTPSEETRRHESIHITQIRDNGVIKFYTTYVLYYLKNRIKGMSHLDAYFSIPYEEEAYRKQNDVLINPNEVLNGL